MSGDAALEWQSRRQTDGAACQCISSKFHYRPTGRPTDRPTDRTTDERTTPTAQGAREAIHNNVDHEMIKRFLVCVRPHSARRSLALQGTN